MINVIAAAGLGMALGRWKTGVHNCIAGLNADPLWPIRTAGRRPAAAGPLRGLTILVNGTLEKAHAIVPDLGARMTF